MEHRRNVRMVHYNLSSASSLEWFAGPKLVRHDKLVGVAYLFSLKGLKVDTKQITLSSNQRSEAIMGKGGGLALPSAARLARALRALALKLSWV